MSRTRPQKKNLRKVKHRTQKQKPLIPMVFITLGVILIAVFFAFRPKADEIDADHVPEVSGAPSLKTDQELIDFGDVKMGEWVSASFELTNVGDEPLRFLKAPYIEVREGC